MSGRVFLEQQFRGLHPGMAVKPALYRLATQEVCHREQAHALMMRHPAAHQFTTSKTGPATGGVEVQGLVEPVSPDRSHPLHLVQVLQRSRGVNIERQER